jgi:hypothetical protein
MYLSGHGCGFESLGTLPCTGLELDVLDQEVIQEFVTWSAGQQGKQCLGRLTSLTCFKEYQALLPCLTGAATNLKHLELAGDFIGTQALNLLSSLTQLTSLWFRYDGAADADVVTSLAALPSLQHLTVASLYEAQADAVSSAASGDGPLSCLKKLEMLTMRQQRTD